MKHDIHPSIAFFFISLVAIILSISSVQLQKTEIKSVQETQKNIPVASNAFLTLKNEARPNATFKVGEIYSFVVVEESTSTVSFDLVRLNK